MVWAINVEASRSRYRSFTQSSGYTHLYWGRDASGQIGRMYRVKSLPLTYILDKEGIIRHKHVGYGSGMKETFVREVESLLK